MPTSPKKMEPDPSEIARSIELLSKDPSQYGKVLAQEAFDHFVASRMEGAASTENAGDDKA